MSNKTESLLDIETPLGMTVGDCLASAISYFEQRRLSAHSPTCSLFTISAQCDCGVHGALNRLRAAKNALAGRFRLGVTAKPIGYMSPEHIACVSDPDDGSSDGTYTPMRKTPSGRFTLPIYRGVEAQPAPAAEQAPESLPAEQATPLTLTTKQEHHNTSTRPIYGTRWYNGKLQQLASSTPNGYGGKLVWEDVPCVGD